MPPYIKKSNKDKYIKIPSPKNIIIKGNGI